MASGLFVDLYELTMADSYLRHGKDEAATFAYFVRPPVPNRRFLVFAGLAPLLDRLADLYFSQEDLAYLESLGLFSREFLDYLEGFRFSGDVWSVAEGEIVFPGEPLLLVTAPRIQAQLIETLVLNILNYETLVASKAARILLAAGEGASVVDFSPRRDHGQDAANHAARASYLAGFGGTSNVLAGELYGIPVVGTMAHSYVMSFPDEISAFRAFARDYQRPVLLVDTYDPIAGIKNAITVAKELKKEGKAVAGIRLDSGDLAVLSRRARELLDAAGFPEIKIFISGDLDEYRIQDFKRRGGDAWGYGVGTRLGVSWDLPALGGVYKLVEDEKGPRMKTSPGKTSLPGRAQVWRQGMEDLIGLAEEDHPGRKLLSPVMNRGEIIVPPPDLSRLRERVRKELFSLPQELADLSPVSEPSYPVKLSAALKKLMGVE